MPTYSTHIPDQAVAVTVDVRAGLPSFSVLDAPDRRSRELLDAVREWTDVPHQRITVGVSPRVALPSVDDRALADTIAGLLRTAAECPEVDR